jgi:hypothetical protein
MQSAEKPYFEKLMKKTYSAQEVKLANKPSLIASEMNDINCFGNH